MIHVVKYLISGKYAAIDTSDAGGMNLLDLRTKDWSQKCLDVSDREIQYFIEGIAPKVLIIILQIVAKFN